MEEQTWTMGSILEWVTSLPWPVHPSSVILLPILPTSISSHLALLPLNTIDLLEFTMDSPPFLDGREGFPPPLGRPLLLETANRTGKILLRVTVTGNRPMVFRTEPDEGGMMTLKKFRTVFGLRKERNKFFFKNMSEDDSSDYQWDLVSDDSATVPLYHGAITAECRPALDSPE
ncbi:hypothetical protein PENTCL1PPCAC_22619 [Pristionchus entomophagus]|uniref:DIX domain-containing protein n=1 Tax=Pristionchus entomophagus TaxID=358040 RepID=A0AAV5U1Z3_9BILA|nr:hypothetical protein PENTCL1PPCAC_22619 [Pristionchus entomophagus]